LIVLAAVAMLAWTWETWPDASVDFGDQRYIPWRLAQGEVLYRDIAFYNGPLSQYINALWFVLFGPSLRTLVLCNLALLAALVALLHYALRQIGSRWAATVACVLFVLLFAFGQYVEVGNYNFLCPYSHEATHGLMLSLLAVVLAWPASRHVLLRATASGLALGLAFLTKAEVFLPGLAATAIAIALGTFWEGASRRRKAEKLACFAGTFLLAPLVAFIALASAMPVRQALAGTLGSWIVAIRPDVTGLPFFRLGMGTDAPGANARAMLLMTGLYATVLVPAGLLGMGLRGRWQRRGIVAAAAAAVFIAAAVGLWCWREHIDWDGIGRPLPLLLLVLAAATVIGFLPRRGREPARRVLVQRISLLTFALLLLAKMILFARIYHYGFVLAAPAVLLLVVAAVDWMPKLIDRHGGSGRVFTAAAAALLGVIVVEFLGIQAPLLAAKTVRVGRGADAFWADARGPLVAAAAAQIADRSSRGTTLAVLPEGAMINCLTGLRNPVPYIHLLPIEMIFYGEPSVLKAFRSHPPELILIMPNDTSSFGFRGLGRDYGQQLFAWIQANYHSLSVIAARGPDQARSRALLLERNGRRH
jgi:hypothetical protein